MDKNKIKKIFFAFSFFVFFGLLFSSGAYVAKASTTQTVEATCNMNPEEKCSSCNVFSDVFITITDTTKDVKVIESRFDDCGGMQITKPDKTVVNLNTASCTCDNNFGSKQLNGSIFGHFSQKGEYKIHVWAQDSGGEGMLGRAKIEVITNSIPTCSISVSPDGIFQGKPQEVTVSWTTTNATSATLNGEAVSAASLASGSKVFPEISAATTFTLAVSGDVAIPPCVAEVGIIVPPVGGLVPCGRMVDDTDTKEIDETKPCDFCSMFYMLKKIINFAMQLSFALAILIIVISGLVYASSAGDTGLIEKAKDAIYYTVIGLVIMFSAWIVIAIILKGFGYADISTWNQINCVLQK